MTLRGRFCRPVVGAAVDPERRLLAAVVIQAVKDARGGDFAAAADWLADAGIIALGRALGVDVRRWPVADLAARPAATPAVRDWRAAWAKRKDACNAKRRKQSAMNPTESTCGAQTIGKVYRRSLDGG